jgi:hypothetical protein
MHALLTVLALAEVQRVLQGPPTLSDAFLHSCHSRAPAHVLQSLLAMGPDRSITVRDGHDLTCLQIYAAQPGSTPEIAALLAAGLSPDPYPGTRSALHLAAERSDVELIKLLLRASAPLDVLDEWGVSARTRLVEQPMIFFALQADPSLANLFSLAPKVPPTRTAPRCDEGLAPHLCNAAGTASPPAVVSAVDPKGTVMSEATRPPRAVVSGAPATSAEAVARAVYDQDGQVVVLWSYYSVDAGVSPRKAVPLVCSCRVAVV